MVVVGVYIYVVLKNDEHLHKHAFLTAFASVSMIQVLFLVGATLLMPVNWGLETLKWYKLVQKVEAIGYWKAYTGVLTGLSLGFITPHSIGDYFGRILQLEDKERSRAIGAVLLSRTSQFLITLFFGVIGVWYFIFLQAKGDIDQQLWSYMLAGLGIATVLLFVLFIKSASAARFLITVNLLQFIRPYIAVVTMYKYHELLWVIVVAFLRYAVFMLQYILLMKFFGIDLPLSIYLSGIGFIFLIKSVMSLNTLIGLGVREAAALTFFHQLIGVGSEKVLLSGMFLWLINILLPTAIGTFLLWKIKLVKKRG